MPVVAIVAGSFVIAVILWDAFEAVVLPRRVSRRVRLLRYYYRAVWPFWSAIGRRISAEGKRENFLGFFGPLSLLGLLGLWAVGLVLGFGLLQWGFGSDLAAPTGTVGFVEVMYMSGTTFVTLGLGDIAPTDTSARLVTVLEAGTGFGFLALMIS